MKTLLTCLLVVSSLSGCQPGDSGEELSPDVDDEHDHGVDSEGSISQSLASAGTYYHWGNRGGAGRAPYNKCSPSLNQLNSYLSGRYGGSSLGCFVKRAVRGGSSPSTHSWGAALDFSADGGYSEAINAIAPFLIAHSAELGINTIHDYTRQRMWKPRIGWVSANVGTPGGTWLHIEVTPGAYFDDRSVDQKIAAGAPSSGSPPAAGYKAPIAYALDTTFYVSMYSDLSSAFGTNALLAARHYLDFGLREGRMGSQVFSAPYYMAVNADVSQAYGSSNYGGAMEHFLNYGVFEGRESSPVYSGRVYLERNPDLVAAFGMDYRAALDHYLTYGIQEGRQASASFNPKIYLAKNPDVAAAFGAANYPMAVRHYLQWGIGEGRTGI